MLILIIYIFLPCSILYPLPPPPSFPFQHKSCLVFFCKIPFLFDILLLYTIQNVSVWRKIVHSKGTVSWESCVRFVVASTFKSRSYLSALRKRYKGRWVSWHAGCQWDFSKRAPHRASPWGTLPQRKPRAPKTSRKGTPTATPHKAHIPDRHPEEGTVRAHEPSIASGRTNWCIAMPLGHYRACLCPLMLAYKFSWHPTFNCDLP